MLLLKCHFFHIISVNDCIYVYIYCQFVANGCVIPDVAIFLASHHFNLSFKKCHFFHISVNNFAINCQKVHKSVNDSYYLLLMLFFAD